MMLVLNGAPSADHGQFSASLLISVQNESDRYFAAESQKIVKLLEPDVTAEKTVLIGFKIADIYPELFTFEKGDKKGQAGVSIKGRLLRVKFAKVNGEAVDLPQPARSNEPESVAA